MPPTRILGLVIWTLVVSYTTYFYALDQFRQNIGALVNCANCPSELDLRGPQPKLTVFCEPIVTVQQVPTYYVK